MKETHKSKSRRDFMKAGLRSIVLSGLVFAGFSLGWRRASRSGKEASCAIDLPCRICSKLPGCQQIKAADARREYRNSQDRSFAQK